VVAQEAEGCNGGLKKSRRHFIERTVKGGLSVFNCASIGRAFS
jgi:hypothetical protein